MSSSGFEFEVRIGPPRLTRFERARIIGARALQLSLGAPPLVPQSAVGAGVKETIELARIELESGALPISIRRTLPSGEYQDIPIRALLQGGVGQARGGSSRSSAARPPPGWWPAALRWGAPSLQLLWGADEAGARAPVGCPSGHI